MRHLEDILSRALVIRDQRVPGGVVPGDDDTADPAADDASHGATEALNALCEVLIDRTPAAVVAAFVTDQVPEPKSAGLPSVPR